MTVNLALGPDDEAGLHIQAKDTGLSLEVYLEHVLRERSRKGAPPSFMRSQVAGQRIRELRKGVLLGRDLSIKDLISDGRE